jgi:ubiquinone/menaquinone biosynthesis C-methylase UbiE
MNEKKTKYKTWIRTKRIIVFGVITTVSLIGLFFSIYSLYFFLFLIPLSVFGYITYILLVSYYFLSDKGANYQNKIHELLLSKLPDIGNILDIGCGNGNLVIKGARLSNKRIFTGIDYWGQNWEYSIKQCKTNAELEGVENYISFDKGTASNLFYADNSFDAVISCLTFHEVKDVDDKLTCIKEALRVLKAEGTFVLFDLFDDVRFYPNQGAILEVIRQCGGRIEENKYLGEHFILKFPLNHKKVLRYARLIVGKKQL